MVDEASIFGRDAEVKELIDFLRSENKRPFSVLSIIGKGGLGKTTIAQLVYKDKRVTQCFDLFGWVCVSEEFEVKRLIQATIESISENKYNGGNELSPLQAELGKTVKGKAMLLVLDDVWNENQSLWEMFQVSFKEAKQVTVLMTTRNENVAKIMQTTTYFRPTNLSKDLCWKLFQHYAFSGTSNTVPKHLVDVGRKIMEKCGGLPLAVKSIAKLLRYTTDEERWSDILESGLWESNSSYDIFPALQISYDHLPHRLKPCFLLCSMYPKDYEIKKINLIGLWISHGYIESSGKRRIKDIASEYYEELKERSFLDDFSHESKECCKLHDIIHDLARLNSENEHYSVQINQPFGIQKENILQEAYHLYASGFFGYVNLNLRQNMNGLRTLSMDLRKCRGDWEHEYCINNTEAVGLNLKLLKCYYECSGDVQLCNLTNLKALRVLELKLNDLKGIPDSIFQLKLLAYLGITSQDLKMLPRSIGLLYNLQNLILDCYSLEYLPDSISELKLLACLDIKCSCLKMLPRSIGLLYNLKTLILHSDDLEYLPDSISELKLLAYLDIKCFCLKMLPGSIGLLYNLQNLILDCYSLEYLPDSISELKLLACLDIKCSCLKMLPRSIGLLYNLKTLILHSNFLKYLPDSISELKLLAYLDIKCFCLKMLPGSIGLLYNLQTLILDCYSLKYLPDSISELKLLTYLDIKCSCLKMLPRSIGLLYNLKTLILHSNDLEYLPESIGLLYNLKTLILHSNDLEYLPESIGDVHNLQFLDIRSQNLRSLPESIGDLLNLQILDIHSTNLSNLPKSLSSLSKLLRLVIAGTDLLDYVPHGLVNYPAIKKMIACLRVKTIGWLKDMTGLEGNLSIYGMSNLKDAQRANMRNKCQLENLSLIMDADFKFGYPEESHGILMLKLEACEDKWVGVRDEEFSWLESLQPHPNLKKLQVAYYSGATLPGWMSDPSSLQSIQEVLLENCRKIQSLPFSNLHHTLKHLTIHRCSSIRVLQLEQLPSQLEKLYIEQGDYLESITGLENLHMLATLEIWCCPILKSITMDGLQSVESTKPFSDSSHEKPLIGRQSNSSLTKLIIHYCRMLRVLPDGLIPSGPCYVSVLGCGCPEIKRPKMNQNQVLERRGSM